MLKSPETVVFTSKPGDFMKPKKPKHQDQADLFRSRLDQILYRKHPLFILADQFDRTVFENKFGKLYADKDRTALPTR
jgi:IS5 family transposase